MFYVQIDILNKAAIIWMRKWGQQDNTKELHTQLKVRLGEFSLNQILMGMLPTLSQNGPTKLVC